MAVKLEDEEGVIKGAHHYLHKRFPLEDLEREVYKLLNEKGSMPLSVLWRNFECHLWEICAVLGRLKEKGLVEETAPMCVAYLTRGSEYLDSERIKVSSK